MLIWQGRRKADTDAPLAQLDRASGYGPEGQGFESLTACQDAGHPFGCPASCIRPEMIEPLTLKRGAFFERSGSSCFTRREAPCETGVRIPYGVPKDPAQKGWVFWHIIRGFPDRTPDLRVRRIRIRQRKKDYFAPGLHRPVSATKDFWNEWDTNCPNNTAIANAVDALRKQCR